MILRHIFCMVAGLDYGLSKSQQVFLSRHEKFVFESRYKPGFTVNDEKKIKFGMTH